MSSIDFIQLNKFSKLHNGSTVFFCKTDYIQEDFQTISKLNTKVILITGNSDYSITDELVELAPKNISKWYCQNAISNNDIIYPLPLGLENKYEPFRQNHGIAYVERMIQKENIITSLRTNKPEKFIYANYNIQTNYVHRSQLTNFINNISYITLEKSNLNLNDFFNHLSNHKMVLCPIGNGIDTHRLWETLYCNRIPIIIKMGNYKLYDLYKRLPIIILNNYEELKNQQYIYNLYEKIVSNHYNLELLKSSYWINLINHDEKYLNMHNSEK